MKIRQCFLKLQLKMSGMFFWDTLYILNTAFMLWLGKLVVEPPNYNNIITVVVMRLLAQLFHLRNCCFFFFFFLYRGHCKCLASLVGPVHSMSAVIFHEIVLWTNIIMMMMIFSVKWVGTRRLTAASGDVREIAFLFHRYSVAVQLHGFVLLIIYESFAALDLDPDLHKHSSVLCLCRLLRVRGIKQPGCSRVRPCVLSLWVRFFTFISHE